MNHLFNTCEWAEHLWNWMETTMQQTNRDRGSIQNTIMNWPSDYSNNSRINSIWKVPPGFITWTIWKERNRIAPDNQPSARYQQILKVFKLDNGQNTLTTDSQQKPRMGPIGWSRPPVGFLKLNFDGASRGNPGLASIGGVIRNYEGEILHIYSKALGKGTNNEMEFAAMEKGLRILRLNQTGNAVIEGDSEVAITVARKIYSGMPASKVTRHWRLAKVTENIAKLLGEMKGLTFQAVCQKANTVTDHLANYGIEHPNALWDSCWQDIDNP
eukprot:PITA_29955